MKLKAAPNYSRKQTFATYSELLLEDKQGKPRPVLTPLAYNTSISLLLRGHNPFEFYRLCQASRKLERAFVPTLLAAGVAYGTTLVGITGFTIIMGEQPRLEMVYGISGGTAFLTALAGLDYARDHDDFVGSLERIGPVLLPRVLEGGETPQMTEVQRRLLLKNGMLD